ncbi:MAG: hypothetical protein E6J91_19355 [Deltaproteobacteria bacterium]|nr:MAG: hypothetical protein E6J91_19355 [Deltaproteobacteria bacterium]
MLQTDVQPKPDPYTKPNDQALARLLTPPADPAPSAIEVQGWLMAEINLPRLTGNMGTTREIGTKLYALWLKLDENQITATAALEGFQSWTGEHPDVLEAYEGARRGMLDKLGAKKDTRGRKILRARSVATANAFGETKRHPHGPDSQTGKTIACFVLVDDPTSYWIGHSGFGHHAQQDSPARMTALLQGVGKVEEWEVDVCAEVDCMKQALTAGAAEDDLVWYCFTWNGKTNRWTGRSACYNCRQWLSKLVLRTE